MKCEKCGKHQATTHIKRVINGEFEEHNLCSDCARELGYNNMFSDFSESFNSLLGSFFSNALPARSQATRCEVCNTSYADIVRTGMMGCANCYNIFADQLMPTINRVHGNTAHCGKKSWTSKKELAKLETYEEASKIDKLRKQLKNAIDKQEFEQAAKLRDEIKDLEENNG